jgi:hypothetical protein
MLVPGGAGRLLTTEQALGGTGRLLDPERALWLQAIIARLAARKTSCGSSASKVGFESSHKSNIS